MCACGSRRGLDNGLVTMAPRSWPTHGRKRRRAWAPHFFPGSVMLWRLGRPTVTLRFGPPWDNERMNQKRAARTGRAILAGAAMLCLAGVTLPAPASAERITNQVAVFAALDKVTARISKLEVGLEKTEPFGALRITPHACYSRPSTEAPKTVAFVDVTEVKLDGTEERIFSGWMFAESPGLHAVEHPVFDVWLTNCAGPGEKTARAAETTDEGAGEQATTTKKKRRRAKRQ